ncbi:LysR substrate-binding domain-containing protein [Roseibium sp. M-1]
MSRSRLPLTALRSFEAAGRHQSFTRAAEELFVSQAAISRQVRELETRLGVRLFERMAQGVRLTFAGAELLATLSRAFDTIETSLQSLSDNHRQSGLSLSVEPGFATCWLLPRLSGFQAANPEVEMMVETEDRSIEFRPHEPVLAIRFSATQSSWKNTEARRILDLTMIPVWSPHLPGADHPLRSPADLIRLPLLHEIGARDWRFWCSKMGVSYDGPDRGQRYDHQGLILQAALSGQGVALVDEIFARPYLDKGELRTAFASLAGPGAYWLVTPSFSGLPPAGRIFADWLAGELRTA